MLLSAPVGIYHHSGLLAMVILHPKRLHLTQSHEECAKNSPKCTEKNGLLGYHSAKRPIDSMDIFSITIPQIHVYSLFLFTDIVKVGRKLANFDSYLAISVKN